MDTKREIEDIKERLARIEALLTGDIGGGHAVSSQAAYELLDLQVRRSDSNIGPEYAYRLTVKNSSNVDLQFIGYVIFLDSSEFEVDRQVMDVFTVPAGATHTQTGKATIIDENHVPRIADVTAEISPLYGKANQSITN